MWKIKDDLTRGNYISAARPLPMTEDDIRYLKGKAAAEDYAAYLTWEANKYDLTDPATREWFHKVCPSYFEQREKLIDDMIDLQAKYAKIRLRGPRSEEELKLEFLIEKGDIELYTGPVWDPISMYTSDGTVDENMNAQELQRAVVRKNTRVYSAGIFSPLVPISANENPNTNHAQPMAPNPFNRADVAGDPQRRFTGIPGALPPVTSSYRQYTGPGLGIPNRMVRFNDAEHPGYRDNVLRGWRNMTNAVPGNILGGAQQANQPANNN